MLFIIPGMDGWPSSSSGTHEECMQQKKNSSRTTAELDDVVGKLFRAWRLLVLGCLSKYNPLTITSRYLWTTKMVRINENDNDFELIIYGQHLHRFLLAKVTPVIIPSWQHLWDDTRRRRDAIL